MSIIESLEGRGGGMGGGFRGRGRGRGRPAPTNVGKLQSGKKCLEAKFTIFSDSLGFTRIPKPYFVPS